MEYDFTRPWDWAELLDRAAEVGERSIGEQLQELLSIEDARFLFRQLVQLSDPTAIQALGDYQRMQDEWGAGFYGMLPAQLVDVEIPAPSDLSSMLKAALLLARTKTDNVDALKTVNPAYPRTFTKSVFPALEASSQPANWTLKLDLAPIREVLRLFQAGRADDNEAAAVAALPGFQAMVQHRRNLGYLPEPLITADGLAHLIQRAASHAPLDLLWKWLNSQNDFDLADLFTHQDEYAVLVETLESHAPEISRHILGRLARYATPVLQETPFHDRVSFTVGWGIAGWATRETAGINLEHYKDEYSRLLVTLTHETFHRFQLHVCPAGPAQEAEARSFEDLTRWPFPDKADRKFYEVLSYIFLEGTATFVAPSHPPSDVQASCRDGQRLLGECFGAIYQQNDHEQAETLINEGLKSNGPFYWLGAYMTEQIVDRYGDEELGRVLQAGSLAFFTTYATTESHQALCLRQDIEGKVHQLEALFRPGASCGL